jgi:hypothetical protein
MLEKWCRFLQDLVQCSPMVGVPRTMLFGLVIRIGLAFAICTAA